MSDNYESGIMAKLAEIERVHNVEKIFFDDIYLWPLLKIKIFFENWKAYNKRKRSNSKSSGIMNSVLVEVVLYAITGVKFFFSDLKNSTYLKKSEVLIFADPFNRRVEVNDKKYEIYVDPIADRLGELNKTTLIIERNRGRNYPISRYSKSVSQFVFQIFFSGYFIKSRKLSTESSAVLESIRKELELSNYLYHSIELKSVLKFARIFYMHTKMYEYIFKYCTPKFVFLTEWYSLFSMAAIVSAKKLNIRTIEVQHGLQTEEHIAYGQWHKNPKHLFNPFPEIFWVWSREDFVNIKKSFSLFGSKPFLGGNMLLNKFNQSEISINGEESLKSILKLKKKICLVTLQPVYELHDLIIEYIKSCKNDYIFLFRIHPNMEHDFRFYSDLIETKLSGIDFNVKIATDIPLYVLLKHTDLHLTFSSSVVIEAESFAVPSIIFDRDIGAKSFVNQIKAGTCKVYMGSALEFKPNIFSGNKQRFEDISLILNEDSDKVKDIKSLEEKIDFTSVTFESEPIWPVLRIYYFFKMRDRQVLPNLVTTRQFWQSRILQRLSSLNRGLFYFFKSLIFFRRGVLCFSDSHELRIINEMAQNKLFFNLFKGLKPENILYFEKPVNHKYFNCTSAEPKPLSTSLIEMIVLVGSYFIREIKIENKDILYQAELLVGFNLNYNRSLKLLKAYRCIVRILFKIYQPKAIFISEYYNLFYMSVCYEAKRLAIPVIEFQHGIINKEHPAYNFYGPRIVSNYLPTYFACFGQKFVDSLGKNSFVPADKILLTGNSYLTFIKNKNKLVPADFDNSSINIKWNKKILVTLQWTDQEQVIDFICRVAPLCENGLFILLPRVWHKAIHGHTNLPENVRYERVKDFYSLITEVDIHVTTYSTTALEVPTFNIPNILLNFDNMAKKYFSDFISESNWDQYITTQEEFLLAYGKLRDQKLEKSVNPERVVILDEDLSKLFDLIEIKDPKKGH